MPASFRVTAPLRNTPATSGRCSPTQWSRLQHREGTCRMSVNLLCINSGSSSLKFALDQLAEAAETSLANGMVERIGGLDTLVCTRGIGEHVAPVRWDMCRDLAYLGMQLDAHLNERHSAVISTPASRCIVRVVPTNEDLMVACHTRSLFSHPQRGRKQAIVPTVTLLDRA